MNKKLIGILAILLIGFDSVKSQDHRIPINDDIQLIEIADSVFMHVSFHYVEQFGRVGSNGLVIIKNGKALLIDTPMDNHKTMQLTEFIETHFHVKLSKLIIGHYHSDCMGGLKYIQSKEIESIANSITIEKCEELGLPIPSISFTESMDLDFFGEAIECRFFGAGHTVDNITIWIPNKKILFGGCLIKSIESKTLGYTGESVLDEWDITVEKIISSYPDLEIVIPGHGNFGHSELLKHTVDLVQKSRN